MSAQSAYVCHIQACNVILLLLGLVGIGLAGTQFSRISLENYRDIDLRILNWIHVLTGFIGLYTIFRNHGSIVSKTLYCVSCVVGMASAVFYGVTTYRVVQNHRELLSLENIDGFEAEYSGTRSASVGKIVISAVMIGVSAVAALVAIVAALILDRLVVVVQPIWPSASISNKESMLKWARARLTSISVIKLLLGLGTLALAAFLEYEHELEGGNDNYIKIGLDHIAALFAICSAVVDLYAVFGNRQTVLNFKVSIALSVISAVWCLKAVDYVMVPFYKNDLKAYRTINTLDEVSISHAAAPQFVIVVVEGVLIGCFCILFFISAFTAVQAASCFHSDLIPSAYIKIDHSLILQNRCLGSLHIFWGFCLLALVVLGLLPANWNGDYIGGDMLWLAVLFITTGLISSSNINSLTTCRFVLSTVCLAVSIEKLFVSINLIYQSVTFPDYQRPGTQQQYVGRIVLNSVQTGVLAAEAVTALSTVFTFGSVISRMTSFQHKHTNGPHLFFSLGILFYGVLFTGCYVVFELGKWRYSEIPLENPFFRHGNGPVALAAYIVQITCTCSPRLLLASCFLQIIVAALALFVIAPTMTNVYYLFSTISAEDVLRTNGNQEMFLQVAVILTATCALAAAIATVCGAIIALRAGNSTVVAPFEDAYGTVKTVVFPRLPLQEREEQTLYWSEDENPYYYHTSKRYYGQPYQIESGFYGYTFGEAQQNTDGNQPYQQHRRHSNSTQTRIGHIFDDIS